MADDAFTTNVRARIGAELPLERDMRPPLVAASGDVALPLPTVDFTNGAIYVGEVRDRSFARSTLAASEEMLERQAAGLARGDASVPGSASVPDSAPSEPLLGSHRAPPDGAQAPVIDEQSGRWALEPPADPGASPVPAHGPSSPAYGDAIPPRATDVSWKSGVQVPGDSEFGPAAGGVGDADASDVFKAATGSDSPKELAQSFDGAEVPVEDLPRVDPDAAEPASKSILKNSDGRPVSDTYRDVDDAGIEMHREWALYNRTAQSGRQHRGQRVGRRPRARGGGTGGQRPLVRLAATHRTSSTTFSDDPRQLLYRTEYEGTRYSKKKGKYIDRYRDADPPNTIDRAHAAHYVPRPRGWGATRETGFGRLSQGWNEFPFSPRERIVNALQRGEALGPDQIISLELGLESYRTAGGELSSSQYRAMVDMISDLGDRYRHTRWHMEGESGERLRQLVEMLDHAAGPV